MLRPSMVGFLLQKARNIFSGKMMLVVHKISNNRRKVTISMLFSLVSFKVFVLIEFQHMSTSVTKLHQVGLVTHMIIHTSLQINELE